MKDNLNFSTHICGEVLLPALSLVKNNNNLEKLIWDIFNHTPYERRYLYYYTLLTKTYLSNTVLISRMIEVYEEI